MVKKKKIPLSLKECKAAIFKGFSGLPRMLQLRGCKRLQIFTKFQTFKLVERENASRVLKKIVDKIVEQTGGCLSEYDAVKASWSKKYDIYLFFLM